MRKECWGYSECRGNFYFYLNPDAYMNILLTFYDEILLIAWPPAKSKYFTLKRDRLWDEVSPLAFSGWYILPKIRTRAAIYLWRWQKVKSWRQLQSYTQQKLQSLAWKNPHPLLPAFRPSVPTIVHGGSLVIHVMEAFVTYNSWSSMQPSPSCKWRH